MAGTVNHPWYCPDCKFSKREADQMVGDVLSGGPEKAYSCSKNMNMEYFWFRDSRCPKFDNGEFDDFDYDFEYDY